MRHLIVFDVDGTILNSFGLYEKVVIEYSQAQGLQKPCMTALKVGYGEAGTYDFKWGVSLEEQQFHLYETFRITDDWAMSGEDHKTPRLFDGVVETLAALKNAGHTLAIVTSKAEKPLMHLLEYHGITGFFSAARSWDDISRRGEKEKPHPDMLQSVMRELNFTPGRTAMVGDTTMDIRMGRAAQAAALGVAWGAHPKEHLEDAGAHHIVDTHFGDVPQALVRVLA